MAQSRFKKPAMRNMYETCRRLAAEGTFHAEGPTHGTTHEAYWNGRKGVKCSRYARDSLAYAAHCAGLDDRAAAIRTGKE